MPIIKSQFVAPWYLRNPHFQTLYPSLYRNPPIPERDSYFFNTSDGDEVLLEKVIPKPIKQKRAVFLIHGLTGDADSQYIVGLQNLLKTLGFFSIAMNFRGAKNPNRRARGYHSGSSDDLKEMIDHIHATYPEYEWQAMGFSLGGNVLLKYLGENPDSPLVGAFAMSVPFKLEMSADRLNQGFSKVYRSHLLKQLKVYLEDKYEHLSQHHPDQAKIMDTIPFSKKFNSFWDFDGEIIAPIYGFDSSLDYYQKCGCGQFLKHIKIPTHILIALDDPFLTPSMIPDESELSDSVTLELSEHGGHVGFYYGKDRYYVEELVLNLLPQA